jgi:CheY-like chemotaxis protein
MFGNTIAKTLQTSQELDYNPKVYDKVEVMKQILLVDDEILITKLYGEELKRGGFAVTSASNTKEAVDALSKIRPDLVVLDYKLPDVDGQYFLAILKEKSETASVPVIVFTNYPEMAERQQFEELGISEFLIKSETSPKELVEKIKKVLS